MLGCFDPHRPANLQINVSISWTQGAVAGIAAVSRFSGTDSSNHTRQGLVVKSLMAFCSVYSYLLTSQILRYEFLSMN